MSASRTPCVAGNWKLHHGRAQATQLASALAQAPLAPSVEVVVAPVFTCLSAVNDALAPSHRIGLAAQHVHWEDEGAFTGEVGPAHLVDVGCTHGIVGHSERRQHFGDSDERVAKRVRALLQHHLKVILCVGETQQQRASGSYGDVLRQQIRAALAGCAPSAPNPSILVAYEPIWAIGTGLAATPEDAQEAHAIVRNALADTLGAEQAEISPILYGGSVKPENAQALTAQPDVDGALVGGASLRFESFTDIIAAVALNY